MRHHSIVRRGPEPCQRASVSRQGVEPALVSTLRCDPYPGDGPAGAARLFPSKVSLNNSGSVHLRAYSFCRQGRSALRQGIAMNKEIKSPIISRRKVFWLAAIAAALAAPATMLSTSNARAQQSDQAPAAEPTAPKTGEKKKKKKKKKATPGSMTAPASTPPAPPKQQ